MSEITDYIILRLDELAEQTAKAPVAGMQYVTNKRLLLTYEAMRQIVARKAAVEDATTDPDLVVILMALGFHDPTVHPDLHDDEADPLETMRAKR